MLSSLFRSDIGVAASITALHALRTPDQSMIASEPGYGHACRRADIGSDSRSPDLSLEGHYCLALFRAEASAVLCKALGASSLGM